MKCLKCGQDNQVESKFCNKCGAPLEQIVAPKEELKITPEVIWTERCPVCQSGTLEKITQKKLLGLSHDITLTCNKCNAVFIDTHANKYRLIDVTNKLLPLWQRYNNQSFTAEEWKNISYVGMLEDKLVESDLMQYITDLNEGKVSIINNIQPRGSLIILKEKEELQISLPNIILSEASSVTTSSGLYGGPSFRITKGVSFRTGAFSSQSQSHDELKQLDRGGLALTNKRLIFSGVLRSSEIALSKIVAVDPHIDGIGVRESGRSKIQYFTWKEVKEIDVRLTINGRSYYAPFNAVMLKGMIEGNIKREAIKNG